MVKFKIFVEFLTVFITGAVLYSLCEIAWRGYTHWTMTVTGGICLICIYILSNRYPNLALWVQCFAGCLTITAIEFIIGYIVNIKLRWNVWDYTDIPFNIMGQVCGFYMAVWYILSIPAVIICRIIKTKIFKRDIERGIEFNGETKEELHQQ